MRLPSRQVVVTIVAAIAGLGLAVALAILTSHLSTQRIGLAGESPSAGRELVAPARTRTAPEHTTQTTAATPPVAPTRTDADDGPGGHEDDHGKGDSDD